MIAKALYQPAHLQRPDQNRHMKGRRAKTDVAIGKAQAIYPVEWHQWNGQKERNVKEQQRRHHLSIRAAQNFKAEQIEATGKGARRNAGAQRNAQNANITRSRQVV